MNQKLSELFHKKNSWENKRDKLYSQILWDYCLDAPFLLILTAELFFFKTRRGIFFDSKWEEGSKWFSITLTIVLIICLLIRLYSLIRNTFDFCYKLPSLSPKN